MSDTRELQFIELEQGNLDKPIDGVSVGTFTDMNGRRITFTEELLKKMVTNTLPVIESTKTESGELVGLPIDVWGHDQGDGAGWIKNMTYDQDRKVITLSPKWNQKGVDLIKENVRRFFSPTIDLLNNIVMGGTLTNWPASRDNKTGVIKLRPIELSAGVYSMANTTELIDGSMNEYIDNIADEFINRYGGDNYSTFPKDIFEDYLVARSDGKLFKVAYSIDKDNNIEFASPDNWVEVELTYVEAEMDKSKFNLADFINKVVGKGVEDMTGKKEVLEEVIEKPSFTELMAGASEEEIANLAESPAVAQMIQERAEAKIELARSADEIAQFSVKMAADEEKGLPVPADKLEKFLLSLSPDQLVEAKEIFAKIAEVGSVSLSEKGHSKKIEGEAKLSDNMQKALKLSLDGGISVGDFFEANAVDLGKQSDYDLSEFEIKEEE